MSEVVDEEDNKLFMASRAATLYKFVPSLVNCNGTLAMVPRSRKVAILTSSSACTSASPRIGTNPAMFDDVRRLSYFFRTDRITSRANRANLYVYIVEPPLLLLLLAPRCTIYLLSL